MIRSRQPQRIAPCHPLIAHEDINQRFFKSVSHVEAAGDVGRRDDYAVRFAAFFWISFEGLVVFPVFLPFGFGGFGVVLGW